MIVSVQDIILDNVMVNTITHFEPSFNLSKYKVDRGHVVGNLLSRISSIQDYFGKVSLKPVKLEKLSLYIPPHKRGINKSDFYTIVDGRHRICYCILNNIEEIEATII